MYHRCWIKSRGSHHVDLSNTNYVRKEILHPTLIKNATNVDVNIKTTVASAAISNRLGVESQLTPSAEKVVALKTDYQAKIASYLSTSIYNVTGNTSKASIDDLSNSEIKKLIETPNMESALSTYLWNPTSADYAAQFEKEFLKNIINGN